MAIDVYRGFTLQNVLELLRVQRDGNHESVRTCGDSVAGFQRQQCDILVPVFVLIAAQAAGGED